MSTQTDLDTKLLRLKAYLNDGDPGALEEVRTWEKTAKEALVRTNALKNDGIKMIVARYVNDLSSINEQLKDNRNLTDDDRKFLFLRKDWCMNFLTIFKVAKSQIASVEKTVDEGLAALGEENL